MDVFPICVIYFSKYEFCQSEEAVMYRTITLPNGARILTEHIPGVRSAALGFFVGAGSRHERAEENGAAHFIEHMSFKGTSRRSAADLAMERLHHQGVHLLLRPVPGPAPGPGGGDAVRYAL